MKMKILAEIRIILNNGLLNLITPDTARMTNIVIANIQIQKTNLNQCCLTL